MASQIRQVEGVLAPVVGNSMTFSKNVLLMLAFMCSMTASATAGTVQKTIFACKTRSGKTVEVVDFGDSVRYSYGFLRKTPDLQFYVKLSQVTKDAGQEAGPALHFHDLTIVNNGTTYEIGTLYSLVDGPGRVGSESADLQVSLGTKQLSDIYCRSVSVDNIAPFER
jgi:hypothetical protein